MTSSPLIPLHKIDLLLANCRDDAVKLLCVNYHVVAYSAGSDTSRSSYHRLRVNLETGEGYYAGRDANEYELAVKDGRSVSVLKTSPPQVTITQRSTDKVSQSTYGYDTRVIFPLDGARKLTEALVNLKSMKQSPYCNQLQVLFREVDNSDPYYVFEMVDLYFEDLTDTVPDKMRDGLQLAIKQKPHANRYRLRIDKRLNWALVELVQYLPGSIEAAGLEIPCDRILSTTSYSEHVQLDGVWLPKKVVVDYEHDQVVYAVEDVFVNDPSKMEYDVNVPADAIIFRE